MSSKSNYKPNWKWTDDNLGWACVRYRDSPTYEAVPANFIKYYVKGDEIDHKYLYKVFWSDKNEKRNTPKKYLKTASSIPTFEPGKADPKFGEPGCYRALVFAIRG